jgi:murein endopeptidase
MLSDTDPAYVAIVLVLCLVNERNRCWIKEWYKIRPQYTHENLIELMLSGPNDYKIIFCAIRRFII